MYKFHHACIQKGREGIFVGLDGVYSDWKVTQTDLNMKHYMVSEKEWNSLRHISDLKRNLMETYRAKRLDLGTHSIDRVIYLDESTWYFNCEQHSTMVMEHGDWVVKYGVLYELANYFSKNNNINFGSDTGKPFRYDWPSPFKHVFMNQCKNPDHAEWNFGHPIMEIVKRRTDLHGLTRNGYTNYLRSDPSETSKDIICYEDLYLSGRLSATLQGQENLIDFRRDSAVLLGEPNEVLSDPEETLKITPGSIQQMYCRNRDFRIKILQVAGNSAHNITDKKFVNMKEIVDTIQRFSTVPIEVLEINRQMSIPEIIDYFNSFDILITPAGSHMIHGLFTAFPFTKAIIEISPFMRNPYFHRVYSKHLLFADYVLSTGHLTKGPNNVCYFNSPESFHRANCSISKHSYFKRWAQERIVCPHVFQSALSMCDIQVNVTVLEKHMGMLVYNSLCRPGMSLAENMANFEKTVHARSKYNDSVATITRRFKHVTKGINHKISGMIPHPPKTALPPDPRYPKSKHYTYGYYRVLDRAHNDSMTNPRLKPSENKYYLSVIAMFKNEKLILKEWIEHHLAHGIDHIYLVDDHSSDQFMQILQPYIDEKKVSMHAAPSIHTPYRQSAKYKQLFTEIYAKNESKWVAIIDLDEFIYSPVEVDIKKILKDHEVLSIVGLDWVWFGSSGLIEQPTNVIQSFIGRASANYSKYPELIKHYRILQSGDIWHKNIINTAARVDNIDVHQVVVEGISASLGYIYSSENPLLLLNHYSTQSKNFFLQNKGTRGDVNNWIESAARNEEWFRVCDINDIVDTRLRDQNLKYKIAL